MEDLDYSFDDISDVRAAGYVQRYMVRKQVQSPTLKGLLRCGSRIIPTGRVPAVFLVNSKSDDGEITDSMFTGLAFCHSAWSCPRCTSRVMAKKGTDIACAIDALATWYHQSAMMITFTLPHNFKMSAEDSFKILKKTWRYFDKQGRQKNRKKKYVLKEKPNDKDKRYCSDENAKAGDVRVYNLKTHSPFAQFRSELDITHRVKVYEFTYGDNGWHPHIHALFWCPDKNWDKITDYASGLLDEWWEAAKKAALEYWNDKRPDSKEENKKLVEEQYSEWRKYPKDGHRSVYISTDKNGKPIKQESSRYISGWSANHELTGLEKKTSKHDDRFTPFQLVEKAMADASNEDKYMKPFIDYAIATRASRRVEFSHHSGLTAIIRKWKQTEKFTEYLKKKAMDKGVGTWKVVCWFNAEQWSLISYLDLFLDHEIKYELLKLARAPDAFDKIYSYLQLFDIDIMNGKHPLESSVESGLFQNKLEEISA